MPPAAPVAGTPGLGISFQRLGSTLSGGFRHVPILKHDQMLGMDTDEVLAYSTKKVVWIRDRYVGCCYYSLIMAVILWILGGQILWGNEHFLMKPVEGLARMWYSHPTMNNCDPQDATCKSNFTNFQDLDYCDVYKGEPNGQQGPCVYEDKLSLVPLGVTDNKLFLPTAVEIFTEELTCEPVFENNYTCDNKYTTHNGTNCLHPRALCTERGGESRQFYYVADIKNYKIRFTSSYAQQDIRGTSLMHPAFLGVCPSMLRKDKKRRHWSERKHMLDDHACRGTLDLVPLPCEFGVNCAAMRKFDLLEDTGVSVVGRNLKSKFKDLTDKGVEISQNVQHAMLFSHDAHEAGATANGTIVASRSYLSLADARDAEADRDSDDEDNNEVELNAGQAPPPLSFVQQSAALRGGSKSHARAASSRRKRPARRQALLGTTALKEELAADAREAASKHATSSFTEYSDNWGDVFTVGRLLALAGADLDHDYNMDGWTTRQAGTVLEVRAVYNNLYPVLSTFGYKPIQYHYEVNELMLPYVNRVQLSEVQPSNYPKTRRYEVRHGILVHFRVSGNFGFFNLIYLLLMLTTAFALTATATTLTDLFYLYLSDQSDNFFHAKYEVTPDFSDMWRCEKCGFFNIETETVCKGVPKFMCPKTTPPCGAPRPGPEVPEAEKPAQQA